MYGTLQSHLKNILKDIDQQGLYKQERIINSPMDAVVKVNGREVIVFCANNYLGLSSHPEVIAGAKSALDTHGFGMSSVRFICGTFDLHKNFEKKLAEFLDFEDVITYSSCFAANGGVFSALLDENDAIISADLNHASLIDGIRLCKAARHFYKFDDMKDILNKHTIELFNKFIEKHDSDIMKKNISDKIQLLLYNNRNLIKK